MEVWEEEGEKGLVALMRRKPEYHKDLCSDLDKIIKNLRHLPTKSKEVRTEHTFIIPKDKLAVKKPLLLRQKCVVNYPCFPYKPKVD